LTAVGLSNTLICELRVGSFRQVSDPDIVDLRGAKMGRGKLKDYVSTWGHTWDPTEYKKLLSSLEVKHKK